MMRIENPKEKCVWCGKLELDMAFLKAASPPLD
jgi:hypothetical protein